MQFPGSSLTESSVLSLIHIYECFLDRVALGTGSLFTGSSSDGRLLFTNIPCGQFACADVYKRQVLVQVKLMIYEETFKYLGCDSGGMLAVQGWRYRESQFGRNMFAAGSPP